MIFLRRHLKIDFFYDFIKFAYFSPINRKSRKEIFSPRLFA